MLNQIWLVIQTHGRANVKTNERWRRAGGRGGPPARSWGRVRLAPQAVRLSTDVVTFAAGRRLDHDCDDDLGDLDDHGLADGHDPARGSVRTQPDHLALADLHPDRLL